MSPQDGASWIQSICQSACCVGVPMLEVMPSVSQEQVASMLEPCVAREVQSEAKREILLLNEVRTWKLFCLVPMMILCKPRSVGSVGS